MDIYGLKNCDSCRKAMKAFPQAALRDVRKDGVPDELMSAAYEKFGTALVNTRSTTWRGLSQAERELDVLALLSTHPTLMKRPLIAVDNTFFLGWNKEVEDAVKALL